jgi:FSR family fosmidomycin resistance protein-like MFS transporter
MLPLLTLFRNRLFLAVASGHFVIDVLNSIVPVLLAVLATSLSLTNGQIGLALTLFTFGGSLLQPLFGWLADRFRRRPTLLAGVGVAWMALWFLGITVAQTWWQMLACLLIGVQHTVLVHDT